jgi:ubiquinone biosynthesis protein
MPPSAPPQKNGMMWTAKRLAQVLRVLSRHGLLRALGGRSQWPPPSELRLAFQELGLVFLKFGQVLALRRDLLPDPYIRELEKLQDQLPALPFGVVRATVEEELGGSLQSLFKSFERKPLATATIAQVHLARLKDGRRVAVKVQRPGLDEIISGDLAVLRQLAQRAESLSARLQSIDVTGMVREFEASLRHETDFRREAAAMARFRAALQGRRDVWIPPVIAKRSTRAVLTMAYADGTRLDAYCKKHPAQRRRLMRSLTGFMLRTIFEEGVFHADPHPGNVMALKGGRLCLLDFGMVGELDEFMRGALTRLLEAVVRNDTRAATEAYLELSESSSRVDRRALRADMRTVLQELQGRDVSELSVGETLTALLRAGSRNGVRDVGAFFLLTRAFVIMEAELRRLDPRFDLMGAFRDELNEVKVRRFDPGRLKEDSLKVARELERLALEGSGDARRGLRRLADGDLGQVQAPGIEAMAVSITHDIELLTVSVAAGSLAVGGAMLGLRGGEGWRQLVGDIMLLGGLCGIVVISLGSLKRFLAKHFVGWGGKIF